MYKIVLRKLGVERLTFHRWNNQPIPKLTVSVPVWADQ